MDSDLVVYDDLKTLVDLIANGKSENTRIAYRRAVQDFQEWATVYGTGFNRQSIRGYMEYLLRNGYSPATINQRLSALRSLAKELYLGGVIPQRSADNIIDLENVPKSGTRTGFWLTDFQSRKLIKTPDRETLKGKQEALIIALLLGCALRREEASELRTEQIQKRNGHYIIANLEGKGNKTRTIPIAPWVADIIKDWKKATGITGGKLLRAVNRGDELAGRLMTRGGHKTDGGVSPTAIYNIVKDLAKRALLPELSPHSLRRTWANTAYRQEAPLDQIQKILGHSSLKTTEIYLGLNQVDLDDPVFVTF
jgi:integrase